MDKRQKTPNPGRRGRQNGAVLVFCLIFLAILTIMGVSGMESTILEERMSGNMQDYNAAFQAAESALKVAEAWLTGEDTKPVTSSNGSTTVWSVDAMDPDATDGIYWWADSARDDSWWSANAEAVTLAGVSARSEYIIEEYRTTSFDRPIGIGGAEVTVSRIFHRITARGIGANSTTAVKLQSMFAKTYN